MFCLLPDDQPQLQLNPTFQIRERFESRYDRDFDRTNADARQDLLSRYRIGIESKPKSGPNIKLVYQFSHDLAWTGAKNFSTERDMLAVAQVAGEEAGWKYTVGRQKIEIGQERLIGSLEWDNVGRSFDGVRVQHNGWDLGAAEIGVAPTSLPNARVVFAMNQHGSVNQGLIFKHDTGIDIFTVDRSDHGNRGSIGWEYEAALQAGRNKGLDHRAWAGYGKVTKKAGGLGQGFLTINAASGSPAGKSETFDMLYPTAHAKYGLSDLNAWRNTYSIAFGFDKKLNDRTSVKLQASQYWLQNPADAWYGNGGINKWAGGNFADPTGAAGRNVGQELNLEATSKFGSVNCAAGAAMFLPGSFIKTIAGSSDRQVFLYLTAGCKF